MLEWLLPTMQVILSVGKVEKKKPSFTVGRNVNWYSHYEKHYGGSFKKIRIELSYDPINFLLGVYLKNLKTFICKDICAPMFIVASFIVANTWK